MLLLAGAAVNHARSDGATQLYVAALNYHPDTIQTLLAGGADVPRPMRAVGHRCTPLRFRSTRAALPRCSLAGRQWMPLRLG